MRSAFWEMHQLHATLSRRLSLWESSAANSQWQPIVGEERSLIESLAPRKPGGKRKREGGVEVNKKKCKLDPHVPKKGDILECSMKESAAEGGIEWVKGEVHEHLTSLHWQCAQRPCASSDLKIISRWFP